MHRNQRTLIVACVVLGLAGCRGCERREGAAIADLAAADARAVVIAPDLAKLAQSTSAFVAQAMRKSGADVAGRAREGITQQLGFDPFTPAAYEKVGIAPQRGALLFTEGASSQPVLALAVKERKSFEAWLVGLVQRLEGASDVRTETRGGVSLQTAGRPFGSEVAPVLHWGYVGEHALLARPEAVDSLVAALARLATPAESRRTLRQDPAWQALEGKVPAGQLVVFARPDKDPTGAAPLSDGAMTSVQIDAAGFGLESFVALAVPGLDGALQSEPPLDLAGRIEGDAVLGLMSRAAKPDGIAALQAHPTVKSAIDEGLGQLGRAIAVDPQQEVVPLLAGPVTAAVHLMDTQGLPQALAQQRSLNALLDFVHVSITAQVRDRERMLAMLERSRAELEKRGPKFRRREAQLAGAPAVIFEPDRESPQLGWGMIGDVYVYGAGSGRLERAMAQVARNGDGSLAPKLQGSIVQQLAKERSSTVVFLRGGALADAASKVVLGQGGQSLPLGSLVSGVIEVVRTVGDVAASVAPEQGGLRIKVRERLQ